ncbi:MAG: HNH endonuclease signature motif containing protein, partial [Mycobacteriales bacterium]
QAVVTARGPAAQIAAIRAALDATLPDEAEDGDDRSRQAREFDLFVDLLTGGAQAGCWHAEVVVPFSTAAGGELELAEIPGLGPILPSTARDLLDRCEEVSQLAVDQDGQVIAVGDPMHRPQPRQQAREADPEPDAELEPEPPAPEPEPEPPPSDAWLTAALAAMAAAPMLRELTGTAYRFPPRLRRFLEARDRTCVFPGCNRPAQRTDKDHRVAWPLGSTSADNGQCLCRHHHRAKHTVFTVTRDPDGSYRWTSRGGWEFRREPKGF